MQTDDHVTSMRTSGPASWLELFYDLVFVAAVVTFSDAISLSPNLGRIGAVDAAFAATWLIWLATTLHANRFRDDGAVQRALVLVQMLLLTVNAVAVGDGFDAHPALISVTYALLAIDVAVMYARGVHAHDEGGRLAALRRNQYCAAALPILVAAFTPEAARVVLWVVGVALLTWPTLGFRFGRYGSVPPFDEQHFVERLGLLTIIVCGESFVKVSLLAADGSLDGIDLAVLVTMFVFVFGVWWGYFDDVPQAGLRPQPLRAIGWLLGHLLLQLSLVAAAVGYAKVLGSELGSTLTGDTSLLLTAPLVGVLVGLAVIGVCSRRVPQRRLLGLRLGVAGVVAVMALVTWQAGWISADGGAVVLALTAVGYSSLATLALRRTRLEEVASPPSLPRRAVGYKGEEPFRRDRGIIMATATTDHYTIISADTHAGANHETYREYLDDKYVPDFDAWREKYKNPWKDLRDTSLRVRNWDDERRNADQNADGVVGEVIFPNTVPPFFPSFVLFAPPPKEEDYEHRRAGIHAHNRWMVDFCSHFPERRAGIGQIFLNDIDDAIEDAKWIKEHGLRGGVLLPNIAPDVKWVKPLYHPDYDRLWAVLEDLEIPVNAHGGTGSPDYGRFASVPMIMISEVPFYSQRPFVYLTLSGVFERFPRLKFVMTEMGAAWIPPLLKQLDAIIANVRKGEIGELKYTAENALARSATEYFHQSCWVAASQPGPADAAARTMMGDDRFMWGSDYPHDEGTGPFTTEHLRQVFHDADPAELKRILADNAAKLYEFDLHALAPMAERYGPTVAEIAQPLRELPENPNSALLKGQGQLIA